MWEYWKHKLLSSHEQIQNLLKYENHDLLFSNSKVWKYKSNKCTLQITVLISYIFYGLQQIRTAFTVAGSIIEVSGSSCVR